MDPALDFPLLILILLILLLTITTIIIIIIIIIMIITIIIILPSSSSSSSSSYPSQLIPKHPNLSKQSIPVTPLPLSAVATFLGLELRPVGSFREVLVGGAGDALRSTKLGHQLPEEKPQSRAGFWKSGHLTVLPIS